MKPQRIFVDGLALAEGRFSGVSQYVLGMMHGFDELIDEARRNRKPHPEVIVFIPYEGIKRFKQFGFMNIKVRRIPIRLRPLNGMWVRGSLPPIDLFLGRGHYLFTRFVGMPLARSSSSQIVYDLSFELHPEFGDDPNVRFLSAGTRKSVRSADHVFTISQSVKRELVDLYGVPPEKTTVGYPAVDQRFYFRRQPAEIERGKDRYGIEGEYILALSTLELRKNFEALLDAYCSLDRSYTERVGLLMVGADGWKHEALIDKIRNRVSEGYNIMRPSSYVDDSDKPALISGAKMLVYPSHYEGFGIPPLEALACGVPVIAANNSSLPEAVGDVGHLVDNDSTTLATHMADVLDNWEVESERVRRAGPEHVAKFSWRTTAQSFLDAITE